MSSTSSTTSSGNETDAASAAALADIGRAVADRLSANPAVIAVPQDRLPLYVVPDFLTPAECTRLIAMIDALSRPSTLLDGSLPRDDRFRTSHSANFDRFDPFVMSIDARLCDLTGLRERQGETIEGQRYAVGQQFKPHYDWFATSQSYWPKEAATGGQRTWTAMAYLNRPEAGGRTRFPIAQFDVEPSPGLLVLWNNMDSAGLPNRAALHEGEAVAAGAKYVFTKWFRMGDWY